MVIQVKINYLKLTNIGPYVGTHIFNLDTNSSQNVILIGGKNGAGKTTFLKSIKYGLFGSFALGLKTDTEKYFKEIKSLINNNAKNGFSIEISFDYVEDFETRKYIITRKWKYSSQNIGETVIMKCNNTLLSDIETKEITDKLRAMTSPQLINSFIYDGEKISSIIEEGNISLYLEEMFNSIFSIDLINQTKKDLQNYLLKRAEENNAKDQIENINLISKINLLKNEIKLCENQLMSYNNSFNDFVTLKKSNEYNFYKLGGLTKSQQISLSKQIENFNIEKELMNHKIRKYLETDLPIYMNHDLLLNAFMQSKLERQAKYPIILKEIESFLGIDMSNIYEKLNDVVAKCNIIHNLDELESEHIHNRYEECLLNTASIKPYIENKVTKLDEYKIIKKKLIINENTDIINKLIEENKNIDNNLINLKNEIATLEKKINNLQEELTVTYAFYEKTSEEIKKSVLYDSSFILGNSVLKLCDAFIKKILKSKLAKISETALQIFNDTIRKTDFITYLNISDDFEMTIKNAHGTIINPKTLSAGEMQILISSLIWSMFRISGRREMFIFDTPLARLDSENRYNFIKKIISTISSQVVILSTDSEFVDSNLDAINNNVFKKYLLEYDVDCNATTVTEDYFGGAQ